MLTYLRALNEGVEDVQDGVAAPGIRVVTEQLGFFFVRGGAGDAVAVAAEGFELVNEFVDDIPGPVVLPVNNYQYTGCRS